MSDIISSYEPEFQKVLDFLASEISVLRTGRATPALVENVRVEAYESKQALVGLASISVPDNRTIVIEPWDKSVLKSIEKAISESDIGLNPVVQGDVIRIAMPALTEEGRKSLLKLLNEKLENARVGIRGVRDQVKGDIVKAEKDKEITEDDKYKMLEELDRKSGEHNDKIRKIGEEKEKEIMTL